MLIILLLIPILYLLFGCSYVFSTKSEKEMMVRFTIVFLIGLILLYCYQNYI